MKHVPLGRARPPWSARVSRAGFCVLAEPRYHAPSAPCTLPKLTAGRRHTLNPSAFVRPRHRQTPPAPLHLDAKAQRDSITEFRETRNSARGIPQSRDRRSRALHGERRPKTSLKSAPEGREKPTHGPRLHVPSFDRP